MSEQTAATQQVQAKLAADSSAQRIARVYAESLYAEALAQNVVEEVQQDYHFLLNEVAGRDEAIRNFFLGGLVGRDRRREALQHVLTGKMHPLLLNFLLVLNDHERLELLRSICALFDHIIEEHSNQVRVQVRSATPLPDDQRARLTEQVRKLTKREPVLVTRVEPSLLGGLIVQVGDWRCDASVRQQLEILRNQLIESSSHEIQAGRDRFSTAE